MRRTIALPEKSLEQQKNSFRSKLFQQQQLFQECVFCIVKCTYKERCTLCTQSSFFQSLEVSREITCLKKAAMVVAAIILNQSRLKEQRNKNYIYVLPGKKLQWLSLQEVTLPESPKKSFMSQCNFIYKKKNKDPANFSSKRGSGESR